MTKLHKLLLIGIATAGFSIASIPAFSNSFAGRPDCGPMGAGPGTFAESMEKRHAMLHDKLRLAADQEAAWKTFAEKMKPMAPQARPDRAELSAMHAPERMEKMLSMMKTHESQMAERVAAVKEFYAVLTPEQQKVFDEQFSQQGRPGMKRR